MKILQLLCFPLYGSGSGTYVRKLSETLVANGDEVVIVAPETRTLKGIKIFEVKLPFMAVFTGHPEYPNAKLYSELSGAKLNDIQNVFMERVINIVEEYKPDVIHVHHASTLSWIANYIKAVYQVHYIVTSHNTDILNAILDKRFIPLTQDSLRRADIITAVSRNTREKLLDVLGRGSPSLTRKTKVVPCGVDTHSFPSHGPTKEIDKRFDLADKKIVLFSGKVTSIKGVDRFIKAAIKFPEMTFVVLGDGGEREAMEDLVKNLKIKNVLFAGYLGSKDKKLIAQFYRRADIVVVPSTISEGIPLSLLEAMSSGTPVVASNIGGIPTAIRHMKNGILVKPKSTSAIVDGIKLILSDKKLAGRLASKARQEAVAKFDWQKIANKMEKYYKICYDRGRKDRATKKPSFISDEEYRKDQIIAEQIKHEKEM